MDIKKIVTACIVMIAIQACGVKNSEQKKETQKDTTQTNQVKVDTSHKTGQNTVYTTEVSNDDNIQIDPNANPENVVKTIIKAAKTHNYGPLNKICNPNAIDMDGDAKDICGVADAGTEHQDEFNDFFGHAKIVGKARIKNGIAEVDIETTAEGGTKETIICQVKYDKWYLKGL